MISEKQIKEIQELFKKYSVDWFVNIVSNKIQKLEYWVF